MEDIKDFMIFFLAIGCFLISLLSLDYKSKINQTDFLKFCMVHQIKLEDCKIPD